MKIGKRAESIKCTVTVIRGLHPWVGLPIRSGRELRRRQVDHALQEIADPG